MNDNIKVGVFLARFQPLHNAHLHIIKTALSECDKVVIMLGSSNKKATIRNPFDFTLRYNLLMDALKDNDCIDKIDIYALPDWSQEDKKEENITWGNYLYYNVVSRINQKKFTLYYSDDPENVYSWFSPEIIKNIECRFTQREKVFDGLSATKIRKALIDFTETDQEYLRKCVPTSVLNRINELRGILLDINQNPREDFTMK